jgi:hypothetical protein
VHAARELGFERADRCRLAADVVEQLERNLHANAGRLLLQPRAGASPPDRTVKRARRDREGWVEVVQVPAQRGLIACGGSVR